MKKIKKIVHFFIWAVKAVLSSFRRSESSVSTLGVRTSFFHCKALGAIPLYRRFSIHAGTDVTIGFQIFSDEETANKALVSVKYYDKTGKLLPKHKYGLSIGAIGAFEYLPTKNVSGYQNIKLKAPENAACVKLKFYGWWNKQAITISRVISCTQKGGNKPDAIVSTEEFNGQKIRLAIANLMLESQKNERPLILILSGTTFIQGVRSNRPIKFVREFEKAGFNIVFSYHRWNSKEEIPEPSSHIVQVPIDITQTLLAEIAYQGNKLKNAICLFSYPYPEFLKYVGLFQLQGWKTAYDCRDDWEEFEKVGQAKWFDKNCERALAHFVGTSFAVSAPLVSKLKVEYRADNVILLPNAVESEYLVSPCPDRSKLSVKKVGYFGHLTNSWFDWGLLVDLAKKNRGIQFEIIGHGAPDDVAVPSNVKLLGPKPRSELFHYAAGWQAAIIPFKQTKLVEAVDPIKVYEYLAFGLPVVSAYMPQISGYPYVFIAHSNTEFHKKLKHALETKVDVKELGLWLRQNTWEARVKKLLASIK